jgi:magnesium-transporting ATPase (P-type)
MNKLTIFKTLLILQTITVLVYTLFTFRNEGVNLFQVFFYNITAVNWNGQFNIDFLSYLMLSASWIMWRNKFSSNSIFLGISAMVIGIIIFAPYIVYLLKKEKGDFKKVLIGVR